MFFDSKRNVSYRGNSKKEDRSTNLERLERERKERDLARLRAKSAGIAQAVWRSHRARRTAKNIARQEWDTKMNDTVEPLWAVRVLNFFYQPKTDAQRLERLALFLLGVKAALILDDSALHYSRLLLHLQSAIATATKPDPLVLLEQLTSEQWLAAHSAIPKPKLDQIFTKMLHRNLFVQLRGVLQSPGVYDAEHRGKATDIAARMLRYPNAFNDFVTHLLTLLHFPLAIPRPSLTTLLVSFASAPAAPLRSGVPKGDEKELVILDNILLLCAPVIDSAPNSLGCFVSLMYAIISSLLPPVPLRAAPLEPNMVNNDDEGAAPPPITLPLPLRERLAGMISGGVLRSVFLAASSATLSRIPDSPPTLASSVTSLQILLPPLFFSATRLVTSLRAWEPFEPALSGVSKIVLSPAQLAPMWALIQRSLELNELCALDTSMAPEVLAVMQLFFNGYYAALTSVDDEDFFADSPIALADAKAMATSLRAVVVKSTSAPALSPAWQAALEAIFSVFRQLYDRSLRKPYLDQSSLLLKGQELALAVMSIDGRDAHALRVLKSAFFLFPLETRIAHFQRLLHEDREMHQADPRGLEVTIRRKALFEDSLARLQNIDLRRVLRIVFVSLDGSTEVGHGGGVTKEFLHLFAVTAFNPQFGLFLANEQHRLYPNPCSSVISPNHLEMFILMGKLLGKMLYDGVPTYIPLTEIAYSVLTGRSVHFDDLAHLDQAFYRSLIRLKRQQNGIEDLMLNFTITTNEFGTVTTKDLKPHGQDIPVTAANKSEYINLMANFKLSQQYEQQYSAFKLGFHQLVPEEWVAIFSPAELASLINGNSDHSKPIDLEDLRRNTNYTNGYYDDHPTIQFFWQVVAAFTPDQQHKLLQFVTGTDSVPLLGFSQLEPRFCIQLSHVVDRDSEEANNDLPTASTCMNLLKLNPFLDPVLMREKLLYAIENCVGFELS